MHLNKIFSINLFVIFMTLIIGTNSNKIVDKKLSTNEIEVFI